MKLLTQIFNESIKPKVHVSTDNFTCIIGEDDPDSDSYSFKINITDEFGDDGVLALYKVGASKYNLIFEISDKAAVEAHLNGTSLNLIKFLLDIMDMTYDNIKSKYPKLNYAEYEKLNK